MTQNGEPCLAPTNESGSTLIARAIEGEVVMLNLLRFREIADYSAHPHLAPGRPISGAAAFDRYVAHTLLFCRKAVARFCSWARAARF
jgi:hypothetical protein